MNSTTFWIGLGTAARPRVAMNTRTRTIAMTIQLVRMVFEIVGSKKIIEFGECAPGGRTTSGAGNSMLASMRSLMPPTGLVGSALTKGGTKTNARTSMTMTAGRRTLKIEEAERRGRGSVTG